MSYRIILLPFAKESFQKLDNTAMVRVQVKLNWLSQNVQNLHPQRLAGKLREYYKLRAGEYWIIYHISYAEKLIVVHKVGHRRDIYKKGISE